MKKSELIEALQKIEGDKEIFMCHPPNYGDGYAFSLVGEVDPHCVFYNAEMWDTRIDNTEYGDDTPYGAVKKIQNGETCIVLYD